jgi:hypothetical protein
MMQHERSTVADYDVYHLNRQKQQKHKGILNISLLLVDFMITLNINDCNEYLQDNEYALGNRLLNSMTVLNNLITAPKINP